MSLGRRMEYGVRTSSGITRVEGDADSRTLMSDEEYALVRAEALRGQAVARMVSTLYGEWGPIGEDHSSSTSAQETVAADVLTEIAIADLPDEDVPGALIEGLIARGYEIRKKT